MTFVDRLEALMKRDGLNKLQLARKTGIPQTTIYGWFDKGYDKITLPSLRKLADFFECSIDYLADGTVTEPAKQASEQQELDDLEWAALDGMKELTDEQKRAIVQIIKAMKE